MIRKERVARLAEELRRRGLDAVYLGPSTDLEYISGLDTHPDERVRGLMVAKDERCFAMTPLLYREEMVKAFGDVPFYAEWDDHEGFTGAFRRGCEHLGIVGGKIAFNDGVRAVDMLAVRDTMPLEMVNGFDILTGQRSRKDDEELEIMRESSKIVDNVVAKLQKFIRPGMKERDIAKKIAEFFEEDGVTQMSFSPIVASGPNGSMPHYSGGDRVIEDNDIIILDLGGRWKGYCSDRHLRDSSQGAGDRRSGGAARSDRTGRRPRGAPGHHRRRLRQILLQPRRPRHRRSGTRRPLHDRGQHRAARARQRIQR